MRLLLTAPRCAKGDLDGNRDRHLELLATGRAGGCDLVLLPEMSLTGYDSEAAVPLTHDVVTALVAVPVTDRGCASGCPRPLLLGRTPVGAR